MDMTEELERGEEVVKDYIHERIEQILNLQEKCETREEIAEAIGMKKNSMDKMMNRNGFKIVNKKYVEKTAVEKLKKPKLKKIKLNNCDTAIKQNQNEYSNKNDTGIVQNNKDVYNNCESDVLQTIDNSCHTSVEQKKMQEQLLTILPLAENLEYLCNNIDKIKALIDVKKEKYIELTINRKEEAEQTNYRVYKTVKQDFKKFCSEHSDYKVQELISQALKDFMDKYK